MHGFKVPVVRRSYGGADWCGLVQTGSKSHVRVINRRVINRRVISRMYRL